MQHVALIVNPNAGRAASFVRYRPRIEALLSSRGASVQIVHTSREPAATRQSAHDAAATSDLVVACGGDGTVHDVLQGVANSSACLGVLPFGTANALARNLGLPTHPVDALQHLLTFKPREIPVGIARTGEQERCFTVMAGAGPDGRLIHEMKDAAKSRFGRSAYYMQAARVFLQRPFGAFRVQYRPLGSPQWKSLEAVAMMAARIPDLGGFFRGLTPGSRLHHPHLVVQVLAAPARLSLPAWFALGRSRLNISNPWLTTLEVEELEVQELEITESHRSAFNAGPQTIETDTPTYTQVDGEPFGPIPLSLRLHPRGLRLLMPDP